MRILLAANTGWYLFNYRLPLIRRLRERGDQIMLASPGDRYSDKLQENGYRWQEIPIRRRSVNPFGEFPTLQAFRRIYRQYQPDLVHHFTIKPVLYGSLLANRIGVPAVVNSIPGRGYLFTSDDLKARMALPIVLRLYRMALRQPNRAAIFQNKEDLAIFTGLHLVNKQQARLFPGSGVDLNAFLFVEEPRGVPTVVMASRMLVDKGVYDLVEAARLLKQDVPDLRVILAGAPDEGNPNSLDREFLSAWNEEGIVEWVGHVDDMAALLAEAQVVVLPTYYGEGIPRSLVEGAAVGRALIASDLPGCREIVREGENGLLVQPRDPDGLAAAIRSLLQQPERRIAMGLRGREIVESEFSAEIVVSRTLTLYDEILSGVHSGSTDLANTS